jgi:hypothetical protein
VRGIIIGVIPLHVKFTVTQVKIVSQLKSSELLVKFNPYFPVGGSCTGTSICGIFSVEFAHTFSRILFVFGLSILQASIICSW